MGKTGITHHFRDLRDTVVCFLEKALSPLDPVDIDVFTDRIAGDIFE